MATIQQYAYLSNEVYKTGAGNPGPGWQLLLDSPSVGIGSATGYYGAAYRNLSTNEIIITHRGTQLTDGGDLRSDWQILLGNAPAQITDAQAFYAEIQDRIANDPQLQDATISHAGHSLGGAIARYLAADHGQQGVTFNAPGIAGAVQLPPDPDLSRIYAYNSAYDIVSEYGTQVGTVQEKFVSYIPGVLDAWEPFLLLFAFKYPPLGWIVNSHYYFHQHSMENLLKVIAATPGLAGFDPAAIPLDITADGEIVGIGLNEWAALDQAIADNSAVPTGLLPEADLSPMQIRAEQNLDPATQTSFDNTGPGTLIVGENGADRLRGDIGADILFGDDGDDSLDGEAGNDYLVGGAGDDRLIGGMGDDYLNGGAGNDIYILRPGDGTDILVDQDDKGLIVYDPSAQGLPLAFGMRKPTDPEGRYQSPDGSITYQINGTDLSIQTGGGTLTVRDFNKDNQDLNIRLVDLPLDPPDDLTEPEPPVYDSVADILLNGTQYNDRAGTPDNVDIDGDGDNDIQAIRGTANAETLHGHAGDDDLYGNGDRLYGDEGDDRLEATGSLTTYLNAGIGRDILIGNSGDDHLIGGPDQDPGVLDNDVLQGGDGNDYLEGGFGDDVLAGGSGRDVLIGGEGHDILRGAATMTPVNRDWSVDRWPDPVGGVVQFVNFSGNLFDSDAQGDVAYGGGGSDFILGGQGNDRFFGEADNDSLVGNGGDDVLSGGTGIDVLDGGYGHDMLFGGSDNDYLYGERFASQSGQAGNDYLDGGSGNDELYGDGGDDTLQGGDGNDQLVGGAGADILEGGKDNDTIFRDAEDTIVYHTGDGQDQVTYGTGGNFDLNDFNVDQLNISNATGADGWQYLTFNLGNGDSLAIQGGFLGATQTFSTGGETLTQQQLMAFAPAVSLAGTSGADTIYGSNNNDTLFGYSGSAVSPDGNDTVYGQGGDDIIEGGLGNDTLDGGAGSDNLRGHAGDDTLLGGVGDDLLFGHDGTDVLDGGIGADRLSGGEGSDIYKFGRASGQDTVFESDMVGDAIDAVALDAGIAPADVTLHRDGDHLLLAIDQSPTQLTVFNYFASGFPNSAYNRIEQIRFVDGTVWNEADIAARLPVTTVDNFTGTAGNDTFAVDDTRDTVTEAANAGTDTVQSSVTYTLPGNVENLTLVGHFNLSATGNSLDNTIRGNSGNNNLSGGTGVDTLIGGAGDDTYFIEFGPAAADAVVEAVNEGVDVVISDTDYALSDNIENLTLRNQAGTGTGNALDNVIRGNPGVFNGFSTIIVNNTLDGGAGADTLIGADGNDTYFVDNAGDQIQDTAGSDTVKSSISYTLGAGLENLTLLGGDAINGSGNAGNNRLTGNSAANVLSGGTGNDTYIITAADTVVEDANGGVDTVELSGAPSIVSLDMFANVENLTVSNVSELRGNDGDNVLNVLGGSPVTIIAGHGNDTVTAGNDNDIIQGGGGNDRLMAGSGNDTYVFSRGDGQDRIFDVTAGFSLDAIRFTADISPGDVLLSRVNDDLVVSVSQTTDRIVVENHFTVGPYRMEELRFDDGTVWDQNAINVRLAANNSNVATAADDVLTGTAAADILDGLDGNDVISAGAGGDTLHGSAGNDTLFGNGDDDTLYGDDGADMLYGNVGNDTLRGGTGNDSLGGGQGDDVIHGEDGNDSLAGGEGNDTIDGGVGDDSVSGELGNDTYLFGPGAGQDRLRDFDTTPGNYDVVQIDASLSPAQVSVSRDFYDLFLTIDATGDRLTVVSFFADNLGNPTTDYRIEEVRFADGTTWNVQTLIEKSAEIRGTDLADTLTGTSGDDQMFGMAGNDILNGNDGNDVLDGGIGTDTMNGGLGNDTYVVDVTADVVNESANAGTDTILSSVTRTLGANQENLTLTGTTAINGTGNGLANVITGNGANNTLSGGTGADTLIGGLGNDTYTVDNAGDVVTENAGEGTDRINSSVTYTLSNNVENLTLTGTAVIHGTGNALDNVLTGNSANNTLTGNAGNDTLNGGTGNDTMIGGLGNDTYVVNVATDVVTENVDEGTDTVQSSVTLTLGNDVENLTLTGTTAINGTGNSLDNVLVGNGAVNTLTGGGGNDTLDGAAGNDVLRGGLGDDTYIIGSGTDTITENVNEGTDTVRSSITHTLGANVENLTLTGTTNVNGTGNTLNNVLTGNGANNTLTGNAGNDTLNGAGGTDTLNGGAGNDTYVFNSTYGLDAITDSDTTAGNQDNVLFGVNPLDIVFIRSGNNLQMRLHGSSDTLTVNSWYAATSNHVERLQAADGTQLLDTQVDQLIQAMANFSASHGGITWDQAIDQNPNDVQAVLAAYWQAA